MVLTCYNQPVGSNNNNVLSKTGDAVEIVCISADQAHDTSRLVETKVNPFHDCCLNDLPPVHLASLHSKAVRINNNNNDGAFQLMMTY